MDEDALARAQGRLNPERIVRGDEDLGDRPRGVPVERVRYLGDGALVCDEVLGVRGARDDAEDALPLAPESRSGAEGRDLSRELEAGAVGRNARRRRVAPLALEQVRAVEARRADANEDLFDARLGALDVLDLEDLRRSRLRDHHGSHAASVARARNRER